LGKTPTDNIEKKSILKKKKKVAKFFSKQQEITKANDFTLDVGIFLMYHLRVKLYSSNYTAQFLSSCIKLQEDKIKKKKIPNSRLQS
jgi:hypothetical protein